MRITAPLGLAFDIPRHALARLVIVVILHALALFAFVSGDRIELPKTPQTIMLLVTVAPEIIKPPPPPPPPRRRTSKQKAPPPEAAAPPLRDIDAIPRTDVVATIVDDAPPLVAAGGKPDGTGTAGAGDVGAGAGAAGADGGKVTVPALIDPANCERPRLPESAEKRRLSGDVILAVLIGVDGKVTDVRIARSSGKPILDQAAQEGARKCRFVAATVDKVPVPSWEAFRFSWANR